MNLIEIGNRSFVIGLNWKTFFYETNSQKSRKLRLYRQELSESHGVFIDAKGVCAIGTEKEKRKGKNQSLALMLARVYLNSLHVHEVEKDLYWLCWIKNGVPVENGERFFTKVVNIKKFIKDIVIPLSGGIKYYGDRNLAPEEVGEFNDQDLKTTIISLKEKDRGSVVKSLIMPFKLKMSIVGVLVGIPLIIGGFYLHDSNIQFAEEAQKILERKTEKLMRKLEKSKNLFYSKLHSYGNKPLASEWVKAIILKVGNFPQYYKGWSLENIKCDSETNICRINFTSTHHGTNANFIKKFREHKIDFDASGKTALIEVEIGISKEEKVDGETFYEKLPERPFFYTETLSTLQYLQGSEVFKYTVAEVNETIKAPLESTMKDGKLIKSNEVGVTIKDWGLKGFGLYHLVELAAELPGNSFVIDELEITYDSNVNAKSIANWKMDGRYAHKS